MASAYDSELARKLNLKSGTSIRVVNAPDGVDLSGLSITDSDDAGGLLVFVRDSRTAREHAELVSAAASAGKITWMAYPKAKQLGTDLNRDVLWRQMQDAGVEANRQVSLDDTWSLMRFRAGARR